MHNANTLARVSPMAVRASEPGRPCGGTVPARFVSIRSTIGAASVALPAISTGIYGYPSKPAAEIAVRVCRELADACGVERVELEDPRA